MNRDEITKLVAELVAGYDMEPEDAAALHEMAKLAAAPPAAVAPPALVALVAKLRAPSGDDVTRYMTGWNDALDAVLGTPAPPAAPPAVAGGDALERQVGDRIISRRRRQEGQ